MSLHRTDRQMPGQDNLDYIIRWALQESVAGAAPSPQTWQQIEQSISNGQKSALTKIFLLDKALALVVWLGQFIEASATSHAYCGHQDIRQTCTINMWAPISIVSIIEGRMLDLRVFS